ncbi:Ger(x)C family spore germination protein [Paenibacillus arenilitoris]|uniref:Ger(X)C family spore germination protein n=1 Tax=Paenibacillus arenilitoris TaxID=2772299 RepID=A0A927CK20_9BACL|nr:Ger(x)C family spore germination protein [Paenibacillus arenilitoris]MBD2867115.1 Ger(x)C family spore germination protein [Paenibacillus arenilitoris]
MSRRLLVAFIVLAVAFMTGCYDRVDMENVAFPLTLGLDLDEKEDLIVYVIEPVFGEKIKKKSNEIAVKAQSLRQARGEFDRYSMGVFIGRQIQQILVGRRVLQHDGWFQLLDVFYRDAKNSLTPTVIAVDGPVSEFISLHSEDKPILPLFLNGMIESKSSYSETVKADLQDLHHQMFEKGITPVVSEIKYKKDVYLEGTTLLDHKGVYAASLNKDETIFLNILKKKSDIAHLSFNIPGVSAESPLVTGLLSFTVSEADTKIKTSFRDDRFRFEIKVDMPITLTERVFSYHVEKNKKDLEEIIAKQAEQKMIKLIKKIQKAKIDPIGLGLYARAYEYKSYKRVEEHWGEALSGAEIDVTVDVTITGSGPVR